MPSRQPADDDPILDLTLPRQSWWRELAARGRPASRRALGWAGGLTTLTLAAALGGVLSLAIYAYLSGH